MHVIGWDIGGANLKASDGATRSFEQVFPLWKDPDRLAVTLEALQTSLFPSAAAWAVTMTGELADCFRTKREGARRILQAVQEAAGGKPIGVWTTAGEFVSIEEAVEWPLLAAASNWSALATWVGRMVPEGNAVLIDIGSTTTDLIPLKDGFPDPAGRTDVERLQSGELVYTGSRRTPVSAITRTVARGGAPCPVAAELFATALDVHLLTGDLPESDDRETANGQPATIEAAHDRLARMLCCDREEMSLDEARVIAKEIAGRQLEQIGAALEQVLGRFDGPCRGVIVSGSGAFLAQRVVEANARLAAAEVFRLGEILGPEHATAACAYAVARLASERLEGVALG